MAVVIEQWPGLVTNASPYGIKPGAAVTQVNLQVLAPGALSVRPGTVAVPFASHAGSTAGIWRTFRYPTRTESIVYQSEDGVVRIARGPS